MTFESPIIAAAIHHWPITGGMVLYLCETVVCLRDRNEPGALTFFAYAVANIGLIWGYFRLLALMSKSHV